MKEKKIKGDSKHDSKQRDTAKIGFDKHTSDGKYIISSTLFYRRVGLSLNSTTYQL